MVIAEDCIDVRLKSIQAKRDNFLKINGEEKSHIFYLENCAKEVKFLEHESDNNNAIAKSLLAGCYT